MANELRTYANFLGGRLDADAASGATTLSSPAFAPLPVIDATNHMLIAIDPDGLTGEPFVLRVTAHTAAATTVTVDATGSDGTLVRAVKAGCDWVHSAVKSDLAAPAVTYDLQSPANATAAAGATTTIHDFSITGAGRLGTLATLWGFVTIWGVTGAGSAAGHLSVYDVTAAGNVGQSRWHTNSVERQMQVGVFGQLWVPAGVVRTLRLRFDNDGGSSQSVDAKDNRANLTKVAY